MHSDSVDHLTHSHDFLGELHEEKEQQLQSLNAQLLGHELVAV